MTTSSIGGGALAHLPFVNRYARFQASFWGIFWDILGDSGRFWAKLSVVNNGFLKTGYELYSYGPDWRRGRGGDEAQPAEQRGGRAVQVDPIKTRVETAYDASA